MERYSGSSSTFRDSRPARCRPSPLLPRPSDPLAHHRPKLLPLLLGQQLIHLLAGLLIVHPDRAHAQRGVGGKILAGAHVAGTEIADERLDPGDLIAGEAEAALQRRHIPEDPLRAVAPLAWRHPRMF